MKSRIELKEFVPGAVKNLLPTKRRQIVVPINVETHYIRNVSVMQQ